MIIEILHIIKYAEFEDLVQKILQKLRTEKESIIDLLEEQKDLICDLLDFYYEINPATVLQFSKKSGRICNIFKGDVQRKI